MSETIACIEPRLPPAMCGTSTFGWTLSQRWPGARPRFVHFVVDGAEASRRHFQTEDIVGVGESGALLASAMEKQGVSGAILQYASRGFHRYGMPRWLARGIARWRRGNPAAGLLVFFHEVPRRLPLLTRHGLIEWINRRVIRRLCRAASVVVTNTSEHARRLEKISGLARVEWLPVPSNIPAPAGADGGFARRGARDFVVFGLPFTQLLTVQAFAAELAAWREAGLLERLHLAGPADEKFSPQLAALLGRLLPEQCVVRHGPLDAPAVSALLGRAGFCLTQVTAENFSKSGTFMAFASHACATVAKIGSPREPLGCLVRPEEISTEGGGPDFAKFAQRARALREWYLRRADWPVVAGRLAQLYRGGA